MCQSFIHFHWWNNVHLFESRENHIFKKFYVRLLIPLLYSFPWAILYSFIDPLSSFFEDYLIFMAHVTLGFTSIGRLSQLLWRADFHFWRRSISITCVTVAFISISDLMFICLNQFIIFLKQFMFIPIGNCAIHS